MPKKMPQRSRTAKKGGPDPLSAIFLKITEAVRSTDRLQSLFSSIHQILGELMSVKNFYIAFYEKTDKNEEFITFPFFVDENDPAPKGRFPLRKTLTGYVIRTGEPLLLTTEAIHNLKKTGEIDDVLGTDATIWLGVPLKIQGTVMGVVVVQSYDRTSDYGDHEKNILTLVSEQIAIAIELARFRENQEELVRQRTRELEEEKRIQSILFDISQSVYNATNLREFLSVVHSKVGELMDARNFYVALFDRETGKYSFPYFFDEFDRAEELEPEDLKDSLTDWVRRSGPLLADAAVHGRLIDKGEVKGVIGTDSLVWLGVPLLVPGKNEAVGVMTVQSYEDRRRYTEKEKRILMNISTTVAFAIDRILLVSDMIHHFNNAITGIKGNTEMLLVKNESQDELLNRTKEKLQQCFNLQPSPEMSLELEAVNEMASLLIKECQQQSARIGKILQGIEQAAERVNRIFTPLLIISGHHQTFRRR